jgi:small subunit ribosomal protein S29
VEWLEHFKSGNQDILANMEVNLNIYGKCNYSGVHDEEPEPVPNLYDERRKTYFREHEKFLTTQEIEKIKQAELRQST